MCPIQGQRSFDGAPTPTRSRPSGWRPGLAAPHTHNTLRWPRSVLCSPRPPGFLPNFLPLRKDLSPHHVGLANFYPKDQLTSPPGGSSPDRPPPSVGTPSGACHQRLQAFPCGLPSRSRAPGRHGLGAVVWPVQFLCRAWVHGRPTTSVSGKMVTSQRFSVSALRTLHFTRSPTKALGQRTCSTSHSYCFCSGSAG